MRTARTEWNRNPAAPVPGPPLDGIVAGPEVSAMGVILTRAGPCQDRRAPFALLHLEFALFRLNPCVRHRAEDPGEAIVMSPETCVRAFNRLNSAQTNWFGMGRAHRRAGERRTHHRHQASPLHTVTMDQVHVADAPGLKAEDDGAGWPGGRPDGSRRFFLGACCRYPGDAWRRVVRAHRMGPNGVQAVVQFRVDAGAVVSLAEVQETARLDAGGCPPGPSLADR